MLTFACKKRGQETHVALEGDVTQDAAPVLAKLAAALASDGDVVFDLARLGYLNSLGISHWTRFVVDLSARSSIRYRRCPTTFLDYLNMTATGSIHGVVESIEAPFACAQCGAQTEVTMTPAEARAKPLPGVSCRGCGAACVPEVDLGELLEAVRAVGGSRGP